MEKLTAQEFKNLIFDYENSKEWTYKGEKPCIIDFYADWCGPCKVVSKVLEQVEKNYKDKLNIYKVNVDEETELAEVFQIRSIPTLLFVPLNDQPQMKIGALSYNDMVNIIRNVLKIDPPAIFIP